MLETLNNVGASAFWFLVVVGVLVFLHESGHFLTAKLFGMRVDVFSLGFGKRLFGGKFGGTDYRVSLIPLGGYVKFAGGDAMLDEETGELTGDPLPPDYFLSRPRWQRFLVLVMGPMMNLALAVVFYAMAFMVGVEMPKPTPPVVQVIDEASPAQEAGLVPGDRFVTVNDNEITGWDDVRSELLGSGSNPMYVVVERGGEIVSLTITPVFDTLGIPSIGAHVRRPAAVASVNVGDPAEAAGIQAGDEIVGIDEVQIVDFREAAHIINAAIGRELTLTLARDGGSVDVLVIPAAVEVNGKDIGRIGLAFETPFEVVHLGPGEAFSRGLSISIQQAGVLFRVFRNLILGDMPFRTLSGPIEIAKVSRAVAQQGSQFLIWMAFISLQLGIVNLFPIPVLDGGHVFILLTEGVLRRDLSMNVKERLHQVGFMLLILLMTAVMFQDISRAF